MAKNAQKKVLIVGSECAPFAKTGGLADVIGTLPKHLIALGLDTRVILPYHRIIKEKYGDLVEHLNDFTVQLFRTHSQTLTVPITFTSYV